MKISNSLNIAPNIFQDNSKLMPKKSHGISFLSNDAKNDKFISTHEKYCTYSMPIKILQMHLSGKSFNDIMCEFPDKFYEVNYVKNVVTVARACIENSSRDVDFISKITGVDKEIAKSIINKSKVELVFVGYSLGICLEAISEITGMSKDDVLKLFNSARGKLELDRESIQSKLKNNQTTLLELAKKYKVSPSSVSKTYNDWIYEDLLDEVIKKELNYEI